MFQQPKSVVQLYHAPLPALAARLAKAETSGITTAKGTRARAQARTGATTGGQRVRTEMELEGSLPEQGRSGPMRTRELRPWEVGEQTRTREHPRRGTEAGTVRAHPTASGDSRCCSCLGSVRRRAPEVQMRWLAIWFLNVLPMSFCPLRPRHGCAHQQTVGGMLWLGVPSRGACSVGLRVAKLRRSWSNLRIICPLSWRTHFGCLLNSVVT